MRRVLLVIIGGPITLFLAAFLTGGVHIGEYTAGGVAYGYFNFHLSTVGILLAAIMFVMLYLVLRPARRLCPRCGDIMRGRKRECPRCGVHVLGSI